VDDEALAAPSGVVGVGAGGDDDGTSGDVRGSHPTPRLSKQRRAERLRINRMSSSPFEGRRYASDARMRRRISERVC
jgi:hypothetical protein